MRIGAHVSAAGGFDELLQRAHALGLESAQFFLSSPRTWKFQPLKPPKVGTPIEAAHSFGIDRLCVHAPYLLNLASDDQALRSRSSDLLGKLVEEAVDDGLSAVIIHPGSHKGRGFASSTVEWRDAIAPAVAIAQQATPILLENTAGGGGSIGRSVEELEALVELCDAPGAVGICIDTQHLFAAGYDLRDAKTRDDLASQLLSVFGNIPVVHLNDSVSALGSLHDRHANLGDGEIGLDALVDFVWHEVFRSADIILEVPGAGQGPRVEDVNLLREALGARSDR